MTEEENQGQGEQINYNQNDPLAAIGYSAEPGDIYYMNPPKELASYPMYIDNPKKTEKTVGSFISYTMDGTDVTDQLTRRYSDFFSLYEKLLQRWPGIYIPRIPPKKITGNMDPKMIKTRMRLLNRFCLNLSNINYLYNAEETSLFRNNVPDVANAIDKLPVLGFGEILARMREAFPDTNENYDIIVGKSKIKEFDVFLKKALKNIDQFQRSVESASEKKELEKKKYLDLIQELVDYEKNNMMSYADNNESNLIFYNPSYSSLSEKVLKLRQEMINPFIAFKDWLEEETLDVEAMILAIKKIGELMDTEEKLGQRIKTLEEDINHMKGGQVNFIKTLFKKKEDLIADTEKEKEQTEEKLNDLGVIIKIVMDNMENQIDVFKEEKTQSYYKYLKMFAILQRESNKVIRELWTLVKSALNDIAPNAGQGGGDEYVAQPISASKDQEEYQEGGEEGGAEGAGEEY
ncbi:MAG: hypothetical protein MJ252_30680 [archaeon]|nr:hypothetical protein [archaeon]